MFASTKVLLDLHADELAMSKTDVLRSMPLHVEEGVSCVIGAHVWKCAHESGLCRQLHQI